jgi:hypothetical protein
VRTQNFSVQPPNQLSDFLSKYPSVGELIKLLDINFPNKFLLTLDRSALAGSKSKIYYYFFFNIFRPLDWIRLGRGKLNLSHIVIRYMISSVLLIVSKRKSNCYLTCKTNIAELDLIIVIPVISLIGICISRLKFILS